MNHEINVSEIISGNKFVSVDDGFKLYSKLSRMLNRDDAFTIDFLGIEYIGIAAIINSLRRIKEEFDWVIFSSIKYINLTKSERNKINRILL